MRCQQRPQPVGKYLHAWRQVPTVRVEQVYRHGGAGAVDHGQGPQRAGHQAAANGGYTTR